MDDAEYTELELLSHADGILDEALRQPDLKAMKMFILAAQHKLELLKEALNDT